MTRDTIFAPATPAGIGAVAVVRISGPATSQALRAITGHAPPSPRRMARRQLADPATRQVFDDALVVWFPAPASFTGEDCAELHIHGGRATLAATLAVLAAQSGLRLAQAGEFARRAFANGKLDLAQIEGLADLIAADTAAQARQAARQLGGELGRRCEAWRQRLLEARAQVEAEIDFADEDLGGGLGDRLRPALLELVHEINAALQQSRRGERLRDGLRIAIVGPPNSGKSTLINRLSGRETAIVAATAGTTRDVLEVTLDLDGWPVIVADTAGLRSLANAPDPGQAEIEAEGIRRALARARESDLKLVVLDATTAATALDEPEIRALLDARAILVWNKIDAAGTKVALPEPSTVGARVAISARDGAGCDQLVAMLTKRAAAELGQTSGDAIVLTRARHREALELARAAIERALDAPALELIAEELRHASDAVGRITGRTGVEAMLDVLFSTFCIGK